MIAIIFEVEPAKGHRDEYLGIAAALKPLLQEIDGFICVERLQSLTDPKKCSRYPSFETKQHSTSGGN